MSANLRVVLRLFPTPSKNKTNVKPTSFFSALVLSLLVGFGLPGRQTSTPKPASNETAKKQEPPYITVQHCLIAFKGSLPGKPISRSMDEAKELAEKLLEDLRSGAEFDPIIVEHTDDSPPGIYKMANHGTPGDMSNGIYARGGMVPAFGDTGFPLKVGEYGLAAYDAEKSPYGWHIVKRIK
jgi:PPIC-type PPIASE domain